MIVTGDQLGLKTLDQRPLCGTRLRSQKREADRLIVACSAADEDADVQPQSALLLTLVEGALLLDGAGKPDLAELAVNDAASGFGPFVR